MKFLVCIAALVAATIAAPVTRTDVEAIIAAIHSPNTDPATAALLHEQLAAIVAEAGAISVSPVFIEEPSIEPSPVIETPEHDGGAITADEPTINPAVVIGQLPAGSAAPIVQIIVKVNKPESVIAPVASGSDVATPGAVNWVDGAEETPAVSPVQIAEPVIPEAEVVPGAVNWVDGAEEIEVSPVQVAEPEVVPGAVNWVDGAEEIEVNPVQVAEPEVVPGAVNWVDGAEEIEVNPVQVAEPAIIETH